METKTDQKEFTIGEHISPFLSNIEDALLNHISMFPSVPYEFTDEGIRAAIFIFSSVMIDEFWRMKQYEKISQEDSERMIQEFGEKMHHLIRVYIGVNTKELYK